MRTLLAAGLSITVFSFGCAAVPAASATAPGAAPQAEAAVAIPPAPPAPAPPPAAATTAAEARADVKSDADAEEGAMQGDEIGEAYGVGGLGLVGTGSGGGGTGEGTIGLGSLGTIGHGGGTGTGAGYGSGGGRMGGGSRAHAKVSAATATTTGAGLPPEVIKRVIRAHLNAIRYCYEKALTKTPALAGKVSLSFTIDAKGAVASASVGDTNIADTEMTACLVSTLRRMSFPAPENGGVVVVTYPFNFSPPDT